MPGDGHGRRQFRHREFGLRELAPWFRRLKAERLYPEWLKPVAVTRHLRMRRYNQVSTRCRPYPARLSREVAAVSGWRLGPQRDRGCDVIASLPLAVRGLVFDKENAVAVINQLRAIGK